jgi:hypothetical protein
MTRRTLAAVLAGSLVAAVASAGLMILVVDSVTSLSTAEALWLALALALLLGAIAGVMAVMLLGVRRTANSAASGARAVGRLEERLGHELDIRALEIVEAVEEVVAEFRRSEGSSAEERAEAGLRLESRLAEIAAQLTHVRSRLAEIRALQDPGGEVVPHPKLRREGRS